jgi:O-antigen/teichoic acid export membrane protein
MIINYIKNFLITIAPSITSIFFSIVSVPIYLSFNGPVDYGNYIFFHIVSSAGLLLNLGLGKAIVIEYKKNYHDNRIFKIGLIFTLINIFFLFLFFLCAVKFQLIKFNDFVFYFLGITSTIIYFTLEGIYLAKKKFIYLSFFNLSFFSLSSFLPSISLLLNNNSNYYQLFFISLMIKILSIFFFSFFIFNKKQSSSNKNIYKNIEILKLGLYLMSSNIVNYIYDYADKYFIKIFLGSVGISLYSIPQQIMGKITTISKAMSAVLLPDMSENKSDNLFNYSLNFFIFFIAPIIFLSFDYYDWALKLWLKDNSADQMTVLAKIFSISFLFASISHLLITNLEAKKNISKNLKIEFITFPFFIIILFVMSSTLEKKEFLLIFIAFLILMKEFIFLIFRFLAIKKEINNFYFKFSIIVLIFLYAFFLIIISF